MDPKPLAARLSPLVAALALLAAPAQAQISDNVVRVGVMADMTGPYSGNGGPGSVIAVRMAVEDFGGKVNGVPLEIVVADDQNKPDVGLNLARKWVENDKVDAIIGGSASSIALGVQTLMKDKQKPYLLAGTLSSDLTGKACSPMSVQFLADTYAEAKGMVRTMLDQAVKSFFFITVDYAFGQAIQSDATRFIEAGGGKVIGSVKHPLGAPDFSSYLLQAQASGAKAIVVISAGLDLSNALKQAAEFRITRGGQIITTPGMTINSVTAMGLDVAQGMQFTVPFYWDRDSDSRAWARRYMEKSNGVVPTWIHAASYSAMLHYLRAVQAAGTDGGPAVMAKMRATPINDFQMKNVAIREDGQAMRPNYSVTIKSPTESKSRFDYYKVGATIPPEQAYRSLADGACPLAKTGK